MINIAVVTLFCIASIVVCFFSRMWSWIILALPFIYLLTQALVVRIAYRWKHIPELSPEANRLFQRYGHFYLMPFAGRDFSSASSAVCIAGLIISIVGLFFHFWWGILLGVITLAVCGRLARYYNPSMFMESLSNSEKQAHEEIVSFLSERRA